MNTESKNMVAMMRGHDEHAHEHACREPRVFQQTEIHHGGLGGELARDESRERRDGDDREDPDEGVIEPVAPLTFLDDELRRCQTGGQESDSGPVDVRPLGGRARAILREDLRVLANEGPGHHHPEETNGQRDEEYPRPVEVIDDVAAEHRSERAGPTIMIMPVRAMAIPCWDLGNV